MRIHSESRQLNLPYYFKFKFWAEEIPSIRKHCFCNISKVFVMYAGHFSQLSLLFAQILIKYLETDIFLTREF